MPLAEVRVGMRGYGLSVFHGTRIEPFAVEVTSVMADMGPKKGVIWIRCPDPRMQKSGAVQGMSGSPIYLWGPGESQKPGRGGRLIGAFAFGWGLSKDCYIGVQPIEYMRQVAEHAQQSKDQPDQAARGGSSPGTQIRRLLQSTAARGFGAERAWRARAILDLVAPAAAAGAEADVAQLPEGPGVPGQIQRMLLPVNLGSAELASALAPLLAPVGLMPVAAPAGVLAGAPPPGIDIEAVRLEPGSVLAIPLAWGDLDMAASGTVTDVLPDGRVLAFGHAMNNQGTIALPMATGFVHFVLPSIQTSFKMGGSGIIRGALIRDEAVGIVGSPAGTFSSAPVRVAVKVPGQPDQSYQYEVVHDRSLTGILAAIVAVESLGAAQGPTPDSTLRLRADMKFAGGHQLHVDSLLPGSDEFGVLMTLVPPINTMMDNSFQSRNLEGLEVTLEMEDQLRIGALVDARLERAHVAPGETLAIIIAVQPHQKAKRQQRIEFKIPDDLPDGDYPLTIADARTYQRLMMSNRPHLGNASNVTELSDGLQRILATRDDVFYVSLQLPQPQLALGLQELPNLPSSRKALMAGTIGTLATPYREAIDKIVPMDLVTMGSYKFVVTVDRTLAEK